jgi:hypothetical protein
VRLEGERDPQPERINLLATHAAVEERFIVKFMFGGVTKVDLKSLAHSEERDHANGLIHIHHPTENDELRKAWRFLQLALNDGERFKYERLRKFGLHETLVHRK